MSNPPTSNPNPAYSQQGYPPQGQSPYPQQQQQQQQPGWGAPPPGQPPQQPGYGYGAPYGTTPPPGAPAPQAPHAYQQPPPPQQGYGYPPPQQAYGYPPPGAYGAPPPPGQYPGYGAPSPQPGYYPQQGYGAPFAAPQVPPAAPSLGYIPGQRAPEDYRADAEGLRRAMKGFGTDKAALIRILANKDPLQIAAIRETYSSLHRRDLYQDVKSETSGSFEDGLLGVVSGPLQHDVKLVRDAVKGIGTKEWALNDVLLGRSNADLNAIKTAYRQRYQRALERDVEDDLSAKTRELFSKVLTATRHEEATPINQQTIESEVKAIYDATEGRLVNNAGEVCAIFAQSSDAELRAINDGFRQRYNLDLEKHIEGEFSGHMKDALLHMLRTAVDPARRDALLLEDCMSGVGTRDSKLAARVVRLHWNPAHKAQVKRAYQSLFNKELSARIEEETSGDFRQLLLALLS